jgi:hypothetical protein
VCVSCVSCVDCHSQLGERGKVNAVRVALQDHFSADRASRLGWLGEMERVSSSCTRTDLGQLIMVRVVVRTVCAEVSVDGRVARVLLRVPELQDGGSTR